jgi:hypothetical protein
MPPVNHLLPRLAVPKLEYVSKSIKDSEPGEANSPNRVCSSSVPTTHSTPHKSAACRSHAHRSAMYYKAIDFVVKNKYPARGEA